jgi:hypothetical protein
MKKFKKYHLLKKIKDLNSKYPNINYGGCGYFSYYLHSHLLEKYNINTEIVYIESDTPPGLVPNYDIKFKHILIKWGNHFIDNNGLHKNLEVSVLTKDKLEEMITINDLWNNRFDHSILSYLIRDIKSI